MGSLQREGCRRRWPPGKAERAERARLASGATKEVLGFIIDFLDFKCFLGFPIILLRVPRIYIGILPGLCCDSTRLPDTSKILIKLLIRILVEILVVS